MNGYMVIVFGPPSPGVHDTPGTLARNLVLKLFWEYMGIVQKNGPLSGAVLFVCVFSLYATK